MRNLFLFFCVSSFAFSALTKECDWSGPRRQLRLQVRPKNIAVSRTGPDHDTNRPSWAEHGLSSGPREKMAFSFCYHVNLFTCSAFFFARKKVQRQRQWQPRREAERFDLVEHLNLWKQKFRTPNFFPGNIQPRLEHGNSLNKVNVSFLLDNPREISMLQSELEKLDFIPKK